MEKIGKAFERAKNSRCIYFKSSEDLNWIMIKDNFWHFNTSDSIVKDNDFAYFLKFCCF